MVFCAIYLRQSAIGKKTMMINDAKIVIALILANKSFNTIKQRMGNL